MNDNEVDGEKVATDERCKEEIKDGRLNIINVQFGIVAIVKKKVWISLGAYVVGDFDIFKEFLEC